MRRRTQTVAHSGGSELRLWTEADLDDLHNASLEVLERAGVLVEAEEALDIFADGGCRVDRETHIVRIPPEVVAKALQTSRRSFLLAGRDPTNDVMIETGRVTVAPFAEHIMVKDVETGERRESTRQDVADICRCCDALSEIDVNLVAVTSRDVPPDTAEQHNLEAALNSTTKPIALSMTSSRGCEVDFEMVAAVAGGREALRERPLLLSVACPVGPMILTAGLTEVVVSSVRAGLPVVCVSMDMAGSTAPVTLAGTLVVQNAELLSSFVLSQLVFAGAAFMYGTCTTAFDLRNGAAPIGSPENALFQAGTVALANRYGLPSWTDGFVSDSKMCDCQTGHEKTVTGLMAMLAGASLIEGAGTIESGVTIDVAQLVADNEIVAMTRYCRAGIPVNDATTFVDEIVRVGAGNEFLSARSTLKGMHDLTQTKLGDRRVHEAWEAAGSPQYYETSRTEARRILAEHEVEPLPAEVAERVHSIVERAS